MISDSTTRKFLIERVDTRYFGSRRNQHPDYTMVLMAGGDEVLKNPGVSQYSKLYLLGDGGRLGEFLRAHAGQTVTLEFSLDCED